MNQKSSYGIKSHILSISPHELEFLGQYFSKIGFKPLVGCEVDLVDCDSITEMA